MNDLAVDIENQNQNVQTNQQSQSQSQIQIQKQDRINSIVFVTGVVTVVNIVYLGPCRNKLMNYIVFNAIFYAIYLFFLVNKRKELDKYTIFFIMPMVVTYIIIRVLQNMLEYCTESTCPVCDQCPTCPTTMTNHTAL
jgi:hypothetical protein